MLKMALSVRVESGSTDVDFQWKWSNFSAAFTEFGEQLWRAFAYAGIATVLCILLAYPMAYFIAFKAGKWSNLLLGLVMIPFFTSFLLRTIAWQSLFADAGPLLGIADSLGLTGLLDALHITTDGKIMNTPPAVIGGLVYSFMPFALLPIYVSLEKVPKELFDVVSDLYARFARTFRRVILPLSLPGVFAATLLVFIPASGDFINDELLGAATEPVIGGVIQARFLEAGDFPLASAISLVLMAMIMFALCRSTPSFSVPRTSHEELVAIDLGTVALWIVAIGGVRLPSIPLVTIAVFTFNDPTGKFNTTWEGFTFDNWLHPFSQKAFTEALWESIGKVALVACTLATVLGSLIALALVRYRIYGGAAISLLLILPLTTPEIVMGSSLFTLFFNQGVSRGFGQ